MSRQATTKSRGEKGGSRGGAGAQSVAVAVPVSNDVVPMRLSEADWLRLMSDDEDVNFIGSIVDEIVDGALEGCHQKYIWNQVLPFTVHQAKDAILQIVQWHFLSRDIGETDIGNDSTWKEDSEPEPGVIDTWAQGSVPVVVRPQSSSAPSVSMMSEEPHFLQDNANLSHGIDDSMVSGTEMTAYSASEVQDDSTDKPTDSDLVTGEKSSIDETAKLPTLNEVTYSPESSKLPSRRKFSYKKHTGRLPPCCMDLHTPLDHEERPRKSTQDETKSDIHLSPTQKSLIKVQAGRPPGNREVTFDERGNVIGVMKLNVQSLPTHRVRVQYNIVDPVAEATAQRITAMRTGRLRRTGKSIWKSDLSSDDSKSIQSQKTRTMPSRKSAVSSSFKTRDLAVSVQQFPPGNDALLRSQRGGLRSYVREKRIHGARIDPLPPLLIETIDASPGVIIQEGEHVKKGPEGKYPLGVSRSLSKDYSQGSDMPTLRMLGDNLVQAKLRPALDPKEVIQHVKGQPVFAVCPPLPKQGLSQPASS